MSRNNTEYYVFTSPVRGGEPICQCRTLRRARNILASMLGGHVEKWRSTPSRCYLGRWLPEGERLSPTITVKRLYKKLWRESWK